MAAGHGPPAHLASPNALSSRTLLASLLLRRRVCSPVEVGGEHKPDHPRPPEVGKPSACEPLLREMGHVTGESDGFRL